MTDEPCARLEIVRMQLEAAGLQVPEAEVAAIAEMWARLQEDVEAIHRVTEARYEDSALVFRADAPSDGWH